MSTLTVKLGKFKAFHGSWGSGLATLEFKDGSTVHGDNGPIARALADLGGAIAGHTLYTDALVGLELVYWLDDLGLCLGGFVKYKDWLDRGLPELEEGVETVVDLAVYA